MVKKLTRVIRCARRKKRRVKDVVPKRKKNGKYDMSYRATGERPESQTAKNARFK